MTSTALPPTTLSPYGAYAHQDATWPEGLPVHWSKTRLRHATAVNPSRSDALRDLSPDDRVVFLPMEAVSSTGQVRSDQRRLLQEVQSGFTHFRQGDVLVAKITPCFENGKGAFLQHLPTPVGFGSTEFHVLRPSQIIRGDYLYLVTSIPQFRVAGRDAMVGAAGQQRVPTDFIKNFVVPLPPLDEQAAIARYCAHLDATVSRLLRTKRRLIALLTEQKQAIIQHAVTRGLDPAAPLADSGVPWLGAVPAHWTKSRIKKLAAGLVGLFTDGDWVESPYITDNGVRLLQTGNIGTGLYREKGFRYISESSFVKLGCTDVVPGDVLICRLGNPVARACLAPDLGCRMITSVDVCILRPSVAVNSKFLVYQMSSTGYLNWVSSLVRGSTRDRVSRSMLGNFELVLPPLKEQTRICEELDARTGEINTAIDRITREIDLIREYRTRLVADVVTGQLDVRAAAASLPDLDPLADAGADGGDAGDSLDDDSDGDDPDAGFDGQDGGSDHGA